MEKTNEKRKHSGQYAKPWNELTITDNFIFCKIMQDPEICTQVLEILLGIKIRRLVYPEIEKSIFPDYEGRSVRLDVYVEDSDRVFDIEIQTYGERNIERRARYYQSVIDVDQLSRGKVYKDLPESFVIFICTKDPFTLGLPAYEVKSVFKNTEMEYNDGTHKYFFNVSAFGRVESGDCRSFLEFLHTNNPVSDLTRRMEAAVVEAKRNAKWRQEYMLFNDLLAVEKADAREIGYAEGRAEGIAQGMEDGARKNAEQNAVNALNKNLSPELVAEITGLSMERVQELAGLASVSTSAARKTV